MSIFSVLSAVDVNEHTEKKNGLTYLSWAWAWGELKKRYPDSFYTVYESSNGLNYFTDSKTAYVKTGVTVVEEDGHSIEHIEYLPVMDYKNKSIPADMLTSFDVNKAIQRSLTKAVARHGLGLYIYAGEDVPEQSPEETAKQAEEYVEWRNKASEALSTYCTQNNADKRETQKRIAEKMGVPMKDIVKDVKHCMGFIKALENL